MGISKRIVSGVVAVLVIVGGVVAISFKRIISPIVTHYECQSGDCEDEWVVTRSIQSPGQAKAAWTSTWHVKPGVSTFPTNETEIATGRTQTINVSVNPLILDHQYDIATAEYGSIWTYNGTVRKVGGGVSKWAGLEKHADGKYIGPPIGPTQSHDIWDWSAEIKTHPVDTQ